MYPLTRQQPFTITITARSGNDMRVITGTARGRRLATPENMDIRPTNDNVKESIFNIIQFDIEGRRVLDLFSGTGQLGIECLSRGAAEAVFVDNSPAALKIVKKNLETCGLKGSVVRGDAIEYLKHAKSFDIIFADPPYDSDLYEKVLETVNFVDLLSDGGIIICESRKERILPEMSAPYHRVKDYVYGKIKITIFKKGE